MALIAPLDDSSLIGRMRAAAEAQGAIASGGVDWKHPETQALYSRHVERYRAWIAAGHARSMPYLERGLERRANPELVLPGLQSVFVALFPYPAAPRAQGSAPRGPEYARYLAGRDYHQVLREKLERIVTLTDSFRTGGDHLFKVCVDTSAVLERAWGEITGLGWIGKNTMLIHPTHGSYFFIGVIFLGERLGLGPQPIANYCGNCTRCLTACPTQAFSEPGVLAPSKCISAWTLETRGELPPTASLVDGSQSRAWIAGCDICQEACPFNSKAGRAALERGESQDPSPFTLKTWDEHLAETESEYNARVANSSLKRVKYAQARRNLELALAGSKALVN